MPTVYRNQFYEIERNLVAGSLRASEAEAARIKVSRGGANEKRRDWRRGSERPVGRKKSSISLWSTRLDYTSLNCSLRPP